MGGLSQAGSRGGEGVEAKINKGRRQKRHKVPLGGQVVKFQEMMVQGGW